MSIRRIILFLIGRAETRLGVALDYAREIAATDLRLMMRYNKIFGFLDPRRHVSKAQYHTARLRGAIAADCGTCVAAEINLAKAAGVPQEVLSQVVGGTYDELADDIAAVARLSDSVVGLRQDDAESREAVRGYVGDAGLIELVFAINGAALLPGIKRGMGYAVACDLDIAKQLAKVG